MSKAFDPTTTETKSPVSIPTTIASRCLRCLQLIIDLDHHVGDEHHTRHDSIQTEFRDEIGRFRVWSANIGAHRRGRISLDYRLRQAERIRQSVVSLLDDLMNTIREAVEILSGTRQPLDEDIESCDSDESDSASNPELAPVTKITEIQQAIADMREINNCLYDISLIVRSTNSRDIILKASAIDVSHFESWDVQHVQQRFPLANPALIQRLGKANCRRRQLFKYLQIHQAKFSRNIAPLHKSNEDKSGSGPVMDGPPAHGVNLVVQTWTNIEGTDPATLDTQTTVETFVETGQEILIDDGLSETTSAVSEGVDDESALQLPEPPRGALAGSPFECPYCYEIMKISGIKSWRLHVLRDLRPYTCTFQRCKQSSELFSTRHEWFDHECQVHRKKWVCSKCEEDFISIESFETHINLMHFHEFEGHWTSDMTDIFAQITESTTDSKCPLCLKSSSNLRSHLSRHMRTLALFVLPSISNGNREEIGSDEAFRSESGRSLDSSFDEATSLDQGSNEWRKGNNDDIEEDRSQEDPSVPAGGRWADFNLQGSHGVETLLNAARLGHLDVLRILVDEVGVDIDVKDNRGQTALSLAAEAGKIEIVTALLKIKGVDPNSVDAIFQRTPLSWAAAAGHLEVVKLLTSFPGVDVNAKERYGRTPLWRAASAGHENVVDALLRCPNIDADAKDRYGRTPLLWAAAGGHYETVRLLIAVPGVDVNAKDSVSGSTVLSRAAGAGRLEVVRLLTEIPHVQLNEENNDGQTPISRAAENGHADVVLLLAQTKGVDINSKDANYVQLADHGNLAGG